MERIIGVLKARFQIFDKSHYYDMKTRCRLVLVCCALHNFIRISTMEVEDMYRSIADENVSTTDVEDWQEVKSAVYSDNSAGLSADSQKRSQKMKDDMVRRMYLAYNARRQVG